jgi:formylglycine-generating enzyme required for sulfatase activity
VRCAIYPWGDELTPAGRHRCNIWQGTFPDFDLGEDGYTNTAPVDSFEPNGFGLGPESIDAQQTAIQN